VVLPFPVITNDELAKLRHINLDGDLRAWPPRRCAASTGRRRR
jgi:hypothetical protein